MIWTKSRSNVTDHAISTTTLGTYVGNPTLRANTTGAAQNEFGGSGTYNTNGYTLPGDETKYNLNGYTYASWTFRKQPKFFDIVTYTGNGSARAISHNLGSTPGFMIIKDTTNAGSAWAIYHTGLGNTRFLQFTSASAGTSSGYWNNTSPTSTQFTVGTNGNVNQSGATYVAYLYASNAGGFGTSGSDNVITCGTFTAGPSGYSGIITLGYEPQWVLLKCTSTSGNWELFDVSRLWTARGNYRQLNPNLAESESGTINNSAFVTSTGFYMDNVLTANATYVYVAIRRGLMKVPTNATTVFTPIAATPSAGATANIAVTPDMLLFKGRSINDPFWIEDRLRFFALEDTSSAKQLQVDSTSAEVTQLPIAYYIQSARMLWGSYLTGTASIIYNFKRASGFFDVVCWTGNGTGVTVNHNLTVAPELIILKSRSAAANWVVRPPGAGSFYLNLNNTNASTAGGGNFINNPTATTFSTGDDASVNTNNVTYIAYLFATCAGVSKVGTYTGTGSTLTVDCGFAGGARFVMIKRSSNSGNWFVWDTARGMVAGTDPRLVLNTTAAEANSNWVYTVTGGFQLVEFDNINISGSTYIFLAIA
jgi:hypothetical protein